LRTLRPIDVILLIGFFTAMGLLIWRKWPFAKSLAVLAGVLALATPLCLLFVRPPQLMEYDLYRRMEAGGELKSVVRTIIPFSPRDRNRDSMGVDHPVHPSARHWFGTERNGADMLSQMIHASRIALSIGFVATGIAVIIGCTIGGLMGYFAGTVDLLAMRLIEIIEAVPVLLILLAVAALFGPNLYLMMVVIGLLRWTGDARFIRAEFLKLRRQDFVQAAVACGLPLRSIVFRHMLPNGIAPVLVSSTFAVGVAILLESTLSFLGLGDPDRPSWGQLLNQARSGGAGFHWWIAVYPGLAIFLTVFSYNLIGQAVRDAIDPKLRKRD
jgi:peptide/nickel transport system permease protein